jgi:hypothetical protein
MGRLGRLVAASCGIVLTHGIAVFSQELIPALPNNPAGAQQAPVAADAPLGIPAPPPDLPAAARAAKESFQPTSPEQLQAARAKLQEDMARLDRLLGTGANGAAWRKFLMWDQLQAQLAPDAMPDVLVLEDIRHRFISGHPGLNLPAFAATARSFADFEQAVLAAGAEASEEAPAKLDALAAGLSAMAQDPLSPEAESAAAAIRWLALRGQAPDLVAAVKKQYGHPNFFFHLSEPFLAIGMERKVNRTEPLTDVILGTRIRGTGYTSGYVSTHLVPNPNRAVIDSLFEGTTQSRTIGRNGPATIHSAGQTVFQVRKRAYMDPDGLKTVPATAAARTRSRTLSVDSGRGGWLFGHIADSIAAGRVAQNKPRSEAISADHAEDRLIRRVEKDSNPELAESNQDYQDKIRYPLLENGQFPPDLRTWSTDYYVYGYGTEANRLQLGAPDKPVPLRLVSDLGFQVHQTALNNLADGSLAGDEVTQQEFEDWVTDLLGRLPERFKREEGQPPWIIVFAEERPIRVSVSDNMVTISLNVTRVEGTVSSRRRWVITAKYVLEPIPGGLKAVRQGELEVAPPGYKEGDQIPGAAIGELRNIQRQFGTDLFEPEFIHDGLELTGDWEKAGKLPLVEYFFRAGWINLAWKKL